MLYLRARCTNPHTATFLTGDPVAGTMGRVMSRNGYSYVEGNPVNYTDPSGKFLGTLIGGIVGGLVGAISSAVVIGELYNLAKNNKCGCDMKRWADNTDIVQVQTQAALSGGLMGAASGALVGTFPWLAPQFATAGFILGAGNATVTLVDILLHGNNDCKKLNFLVSYLGMVLSAVGLVGGAYLPPPGTVTNAGATAAMTLNSAVLAADVAAGASVAGTVASSTGVVNSISMAKSQSGGGGELRTRAEAEAEAKKTAGIPDDATPVVETAHYAGREPSAAGANQVGNAQDFADWTQLADDANKRVDPYGLDFDNALANDMTPARAETSPGRIGRMSFYDTENGPRAVVEHFYYVDKIMNQPHFHGVGPGKDFPGGSALNFARYLFNNPQASYQEFFPPGSSDSHIFYGGG